VARRLEEGETVRDLSAYVQGIARLVAIERLKQSLKQEPLGDRFAAPESPVDEDAERRRKCLDEALASVTPNNRRLILAYYRGAGGGTIAARKGLASGLGIPVNALRIRAHRIRAAVEQLVRACLEQRRNKNGSADTSL
jgi:DNA-directed RNA polymerase specialized sigma24 family protein